MHDHIDLYCERVSEGLWAEPLNAFTNGAFILAMIAGMILAKRHNTLKADMWALLTLIGTIGLGSFLFHTFATPLTMLADSTPILLYQMLFLLLYSNNIMKLDRAVTCGLLTAFLATVLVCSFVPQSVLNGSVSYIPAAIFLFGLGFYHFNFQKPEPIALLYAGLTFCASLTFRTLDDTICNALPQGTHFIWHILNAYVLFLTIKAYSASRAEEHTNKQG